MNSTDIDKKKSYLITRDTAKHRSLGVRTASMSLLLPPLPTWSTQLSAVNSYKYDSRTIWVLSVFQNWRTPLTVTNEVQLHPTQIPRTTTPLPEHRPSCRSPLSHSLRHESTNLAFVLVQSNSLIPTVMASLTYAVAICLFCQPHTAWRGRILGDANPADIT